jgi:hypothetical protein
MTLEMHSAWHGCCTRQCCTRRITWSCGEGSNSLGFVDGTPLGDSSSSCVRAFLLKLVGDFNLEKP